MGQLIRFVSAHEVGHTLGLPHNMGSSSAYPTDSLRSPKFTATHGTAPSIMDYARFNYIAQPEDSVTNFYPGLGEYDDWAIWYGYRPIVDVSSPEDEKAILKSWVKEKGDNPIFRYGRQRPNTPDPSAQTEDLGDDSMVASEYGIRNLKRIMDQVMDWSATDGKNYEDLSELYNSIFGQYSRYMGHVTTNIGGVYEVYKTSDQDGLVYSHASLEKQKRAVQFLNEQLFTTPNWLVDTEIIGRVMDGGFVDKVKDLQTQYLDRLLNEDRLKRVIENETLNETSAYSSESLFRDIRRGIFSELRTSQNIDTYRRNLQKAMVEKMGELANNEENSIRTSDIPSLARGHLTALRSEINTGITRQKDKMSIYHLQDLSKRIDFILDPN
ncbi:MAG: zinc-dependent metalloprotease [Bacteroidetes bacterium]|nr:zinc-dependent metalloprotease [Bacteroidota bacterium]